MRTETVALPFYAALGKKKWHRSFLWTMLCILCCRVGQGRRSQQYALCAIWTG